MFICLDCGSVFDEPEYFYDHHGMETPPYEVYKGCPGCGGAYTDALVSNTNFLSELFPELINVRW